MVAVIFFKIILKFNTYINNPDKNNNFGKQPEIFRDKTIPPSQN